VLGGVLEQPFAYARLVAASEEHRRHAVVKAIQEGRREHVPVCDDAGRAHRRVELRELESARELQPRPVRHVRAQGCLQCARPDQRQAIARPGENFIDSIEQRAHEALRFEVGKVFPG
jgi:hypothetical protein